MEYEFKTTFWSDFTIAEAVGVKAIKDNFDRAFNEWKDDVVYLTELVLVTNWKLWMFNDSGNEAYTDLYYKLYEKANNYAYENLKGEDKKYFFDVTD